MTLPGRGSGAHDLALEGLLRRLARAPHADRWALRGSALTRLYCAPFPRAAHDLDVLSLDPYDRAQGERQIEALLAPALDDGCAYGPPACQVIWAESPSPGLRFTIPASVASYRGEVQLDVAYNDPVEPPPRWVDIPTREGPARVLGCARETLIAWKIHGLFEKGLGTFRPKDLNDIALLSRGEIDEAALHAALKCAFDSRKAPLWWVKKLAQGSMGKSPWSAHKWKKFREASAPIEVSDIGDITDEIARTLGPMLLALEGVGDAP